MLKLEQDVFLQLGGESRRMLHPSKVVEVNDRALTVMLEENELSFDVEGDILTVEKDLAIFIYYNLRRKFLKQAARIDAVFQPEDDMDDHYEDDQSNALVRLEFAGPPIPAESRQFYRISTLHAELTVSFGGSATCQLVDVSAKGFAVISPEKYKVGNVVSAAHCYKQLRSTGVVCIQSAQALSNGCYRYGVHCIEKKFQADMQKLCMLLQRQQLRRLACRT